MDIPEGWAVVEERLMREFEFSNFDQAKQLVDAISLHASEVGHHPELHFGWGYVIVELYTHDTSSITEQDLTFATQINQLPEVK
tara:strand:+ start:706 stop:957 length:252 start_codon:yes stop_codon:yes gene_type:complete